MQTPATKKQETKKLEEFIWTDAHIRWMSDAAKKSKLYYWIAERIAAYIAPTSRVFNAGGGLGDLAIWLSYHVEEVTVIENDPKAVAALRTRCPQNVVAILGDVHTYAPDKLYDSLVLFDVGGAEETLPVVRELSRAKTFVLADRDTAAGEADLRELSETLKNAGIPFTYELFEQEHIQPFRSREDARSYFLSISNRQLTDEALDALLETSDDSKLPLSYVEQKKIGMIVFDAANPALKKPII
ncbi:MAG: hypothetical protein C0413_02725 [Clostridiales bacterium]|nr:hypothetical protein [Clostridiales bacterium]